MHEPSSGFGMTETSKQKPSYHPRLLDHPMSACLAIPSSAPSLGVPDGHRGAVQGFVGALLSLRERHQVQGYGLDELYVGARQAIELRMVGQGGASIPQVSIGVAGDDLALGEGCFGPGFVFGG